MKACFLDGRSGDVFVQQTPGGVCSCSPLEVLSFVPVMAVCFIAPVGSACLDLKLILDCPVHSGSFILMLPLIHGWYMFDLVIFFIIIIIYYLFRC